MMYKFTRILIIFSTITSFLVDTSNGILCYRCDSQVEEDCALYPAPLSIYEDCSERQRPPINPFPKPEEGGILRSIYVRYRYQLCPLLERTVKHIMPTDFCKTEMTIEPEPAIRTSPAKRPYSANRDPMDGSNLVCGKALTHGPNGVRIRRGCTRDLFLNGTNACVSVSPNGATDVACFCTTDFCNHGVSKHHLYPGKGIMSTLHFIGSAMLGHIIEQSLFRNLF